MVVYSFSSDIYQGDGGVTEYHKSKSTKGSLSSLAEIKAFIEVVKCGGWIMKMLNFGIRLIYRRNEPLKLLVLEGKLIFDHVQSRSSQREKRC